MDRKDILTKALIAFLILVFIGGIVFGAMEVLSTEGQHPPEEPYKQSLSPRPESKEDILAYLNTCVDRAASEQAKLEVSVSLSIDKDSVSFGDNGALLAQSFIYAQSGILEQLAARYPASGADFGEAFENPLRPLIPAADAINEAESAEEDDRYRFTLTFPDESDPFAVNSAVKEGFRMAQTEAVLGYFLESYEGFADADAVRVTVKELKIDADVNRLEDTVQTLTFSKTLVVTAEVTFRGELAAVGTRAVSFTLEEKTHYRFTLANLALKPQTLALKKGEIKVIGAFVTASGDPTVQWSSSDPDIASVDAEGYVRAHRTSPDPVTITAQFEFLNKTYAAQTAVTVTVPVSKVKLSRYKLTLTPAQTAALTASVRPRDATIQSVLWFSDNPAVATVDADGTVTAIAPGQTTVYALTKDGYYKRSCAVTVLNP